LPLAYCNILLGNGVKQHQNVTNSLNVNAIGQRMDARMPFLDTTVMLPLAYCNILLGNGVKQHQNVTNSFNVNAIGQRMDAIVAVFYAGIILIILLSNAHRFRTNKTNKKRKKSKKFRKILSSGLIRGVTPTRAPTSCKANSSTNIEKHIIVHNNREMTVVDTSDKYPETII
ncbi:unnamed protein product, partial [Oppiella nova]